MHIYIIDLWMKWHVYITELSRRCIYTHDGVFDCHCLAVRSAVNEENVRNAMATSGHCVGSCPGQTKHGTPAVHLAHIFTPSPRSHPQVTLSPGSHPPQGHTLPKVTLSPGSPPPQGHTLTPSPRSHSHTLPKVTSSPGFQ